MIRETVLPFKLGTTDDTITANGGLALVGEFLRAMDLGALVDGAFPAPGSARGYSAWAYLFPLILMLHAGGRSLEDLRKIADDEGLLRLLEVGEVPSADALGDWLRRLGRRGTRALQAVHRKVLERAMRASRRKGYTLDMDATAIEAWKESALFTYKHFKGYLPMLGHLAENGLVVAWEFREGNVPPAGQNLDFYRQCKASMPPGKRIAEFRADAASYQGELFDELARDGVAYAVGGRLDRATLDVIGAIRPGQWMPYQDGWIAETVHTMNSMETAFRLVVIRRPAQPELSGEVDPSERYHVIASSREETAVETVAWYNRRGDCSENRIKELKCGFGMGRMPCGQFEANGLFFGIGVLAYNLYKMFVGLIMWGGFARKQVQSVRYAIYNLAGKVVSSGGQLWLKVSTAHFGLFEMVRRSIFQFGSG